MVGGAAGPATFDTTSYIQYPGSFRVDATTASGPVVQVFSGGECWVKDARGVAIGAGRPRPIRCAAPCSATSSGCCWRSPTARSPRHASSRRRRGGPRPDRDWRRWRRHAAGRSVARSRDGPDSSRSATTRRQARPARTTVEEQFSDYRNVDGLQVAFAAVVAGGRAAGAHAPRAHVRVQRPARRRSLHEACARSGSPTVRVMISCGEPSGDLYAGALAREILQIESVRGHHRLRQRSASQRRRRARRATSGAVGDRPPRSRARAAAHVRDLSPARGATPRPTRPDVFVAIDFPDFNFRLARALRQARRAGRLLHQPAAVGLAPGTDEDDEAHRRSRAGHLSRSRRRSTGAPASPVEWVGHPLLDVAAAAAAARHLPRRPRPRPGAARRGAAARQPQQRGARHPAGSARCRAYHPRRLPAAQFVLARAPHLPDELFCRLDADGPAHHGGRERDRRRAGRGGRGARSPRAP